MNKIKITRENWREIFNQKYGMKMKAMNLNEYMLLNNIAQDIEEIIENVRIDGIQEVINYLSSIIPEQKPRNFWGGIEYNFLRDYLISTIKLIHDKFIK